MKRDYTKKNLTPLSGNDLATVPLHYLSFPCFFAIVTISEIFCLMRYGSVTNALFRFFCSVNRNFIQKPILASLKTHIHALYGMCQRTERNVIYTSLSIRQHGVVSYTSR